MVSKNAFLPLTSQLFTYTLYLKGTGYFNAFHNASCGMNADKNQRIKIKLLHRTEVAEQENFSFYFFLFIKSSRLNTVITTDKKSIMYQIDNKDKRCKRLQQVT